MANTADLTTKYHIGESLPHKWASVYSYTPNSPEMIASKGSIFAVFGLFAPEGFNAITAGNLLIDHFHEVYFESKAESVSAALSEAVMAASERLTELLVNEERASEEGVDLNIAAVSVRDNEIYFASLGSNRIYTIGQSVTGEGKLVELASSLRDPFARGLVKVGSSYWRSGQKFLISSYTDGQSENYLQALQQFDLSTLQTMAVETPEEMALLLLGIDLQPEPEIIPALESREEELLPLENPDPEVENYQPAEELPDAFTPADIPLEPTEEVLAETENTSSWASRWQSVRGAVQKRISQFRRNRELKQLQSLRDNAATANFDPLYPQHQGTYTLKDRALRRLRSWKDYFLYDLLKVNQAGRSQSRFELVRLPDGSRFLVIGGVSVSFKLLAVVGIVICGLLAYNLVSNIGAERARQAEILKAMDKLTFIQGGLDRLQQSPVLSTRSTGGVTQREQLLTDLQKIEGQFTADLNVLPTSETEPQKTRIKTLRQQILKVKEVAPTLLADIATLYQGTITDITRVGENLYILDGSTGKIYRQPIAGGGGEEVISGLGQPTALAADANGELIVYLATGSDVLISVNPATKTRATITGVNRDRLPQVTNLSIYGTTNSLYSTSAGIPEVKQMPRSGRNYSTPTTRYRDNNLGELRDLEIVDARVTILAAGKGLVRVGLETARFDGFSNVVEAIAQASAFASDDDYFYFADNVNKQLLIFTKNRDTQPISDFVAQVPLTGITGDIVEVIADRNTGTVVLATSGTLYKFTRTTLVN